MISRLLKGWDIRFQHNVMANNDVIIVVTLSLLVVIAPFFSKITRLPTTPVEILLGILAGYFGLLYDHPIFIIIAEVGFFYLMFLAGLEVNIRVLLEVSTAVKKKTLYYLVLLYVLSLGATFLFGFDPLYAVMFPLISVGLILSLIKEYGKSAPWLHLSMVVGTVGEILSIAVLTITAGFLEFGDHSEFYMTVLYLILFIGFIIVFYKGLKLLFWWYPHFKTKLMPVYEDKDEQDIRLSMAIFFMLIAMMMFLHLEVAFGAFIAGIFIAAFFSHKKELPHKLESFGFGFLIPIFFIYIGSTFDVRALSDGIIAQNAMLIVVAMMGIRFISAFIFYAELGLKGVSLFALSHSMPLTLLIAASTIAYQTKVIDATGYFSFVLASLIEVIVAMIVVKVINKKTPHLELMH